MISRTVLVAPEPFGELTAARVAAALGRGLIAGDCDLAVDLCPVEAVKVGPDELDALGFDGRMRAARAVLLGASRLDESTLLGSTTFELATRARQAGVPAYAIASENTLGLFDARILDLQVVLQARGIPGLRRAGEELAALV